MGYKCLSIFSLSATTMTEIAAFPHLSASVFSLVTLQYFNMLKLLMLSKKSDQRISEWYVHVIGDN